MLPLFNWIDLKKHVRAICKTVEVLRSRIYKKMQVHHVAPLVRMVLKHTPPEIAWACDKGVSRRLTLKSGPNGRQRRDKVFRKPG